MGTNYAIGNAEKFGNSDWGQGTTPTSSSANKTTDLTSQINGTASVFTMPEEYVSGSLRIYYNGVRQIVGVTATETSSTTFSLSFVPLPGDVLNVDYRSSTSCS